jgi:hypothetical protein
MTADDVTFCAVPFKLEEGDEFFDKGRRFKIEQFDGERYTFESREKMDEFVNVHGFRLINEADMVRLRKEYDKPKAE